MSLEDEIAMPIDDRFAADWSQFVQRVVKARFSLIDAVAWTAYTQNSPYGVLVDCDGVRIDKSVPPLTIHYRDQHCGPGLSTFTATFTIPD